MTDATTGAAAALARREHRTTVAATGARTAPPVAALGKAAELADQPPLFTLAAATLALGLASGRSGLVRTGARMLAAEAIATGIKAVLKRGIDRARPNQALKSGPVVGHGRGDADSAFNSFPSGHTAGAVAVAQAVAHEHPHGALPARAVAAAVGAVQLPRGHHYLSDVAVGAAVGWVAERAAGLLVDWVEQRLASPVNPLAEAEAHPS